MKTHINILNKHDICELAFWMYFGLFNYFIQSASDLVPNGMFPYHFDWQICAHAILEIRRYVRK